MDETKENLLAIPGAAQQRMIQTVERLDDALLEEPFPDESYFDVFPTIRHAFDTSAVAHKANHIGQEWVWRKAMELPPMQRSLSKPCCKKEGVLN